MFPRGGMTNELCRGSLRSRRFSPEVNAKTGRAVCAFDLHLTTGCRGQIALRVNVMRVSQACEEGSPYSFKALSDNGTLEMG